MSNGKGDRNRSANKKYWQNYLDINWGDGQHPEKNKKLPNKKLNCIGGEKCQINTETGE